ncbi:hypothetical protein [Azotobacter beijerinckii]|nr:hypothetical protein [Azotobacter beijerinckii]
MVGKVTNMLWLRYIADGPAIAEQEKLLKQAITAELKKRGAK